MTKRDDTYFAAFRAGGRRIHRRLSSDFKTAGELLNELKARADRGHYGMVDNDCPSQSCGPNSCAGLASPCAGRTSMRAT